jgi:peptide/nickel transport system substrate-binding protein
MKENVMSLLAGGVVLTMILLTGNQLVVAAPPAGEVKTVASSIGNGTLLPAHELPNHANDWMQLLYDHLVGCNPAGKFTPELGLANKWETSPDGLTWIFYLRKGVKFHDGVELTAKDVKFSIEQVMSPDATVGEAPAFRKDVKSVDIRDPYTVVISLKQPDISLANLLSNIESVSGMVIPKDYYERVGREEFVKHPIGSGPYKFHSQSVGSFLKLEATDKHWRDGVPKYKYMTYTIIPEDSTRLAMLRAGEADIARISRDTVKEALGAGLNIVTKENASVLIFHANMQWTSPVFSDIRFRKALNLAVDKEAIIKQILGGMAKPIATYPGRNISGAGGDLTLKPYPYDPQEARRLIKEGGWEGHEFGLISYPRAGCPEYPLVVEAMAGYWEKVGLKPKIRNSDWSVWVATWRERKCQNTVHGYDSTTTPDVGAIMIKFQEKWDFSTSGRSTVNIPDLNEKFRRMEKSKDVNEISKILAEIYRYAYDNYLMVPMCELSEKIATRKWIPTWNAGIRNDRNYYELIRQR